MDRFTLDRAVQEMRDHYGMGAYRAAMALAETAERRGLTSLACDWREIAEACKVLKEPPSIEK